MRSRILALTIALLSPLPLVANQLPTGGVCEKSKVISEHLTFRTRAEWNRDQATVTSDSKVFPAQVISVRPHGDTFKINLAYQDEIMGDSELIIFRTPGIDEAAYRMGIVHFENDGGRRVADAIYAFEPVDCAIFY